MPPEKNQPTGEKKAKKQRLQKRQKQYLTEYNVFRDARKNDVLYMQKKMCASAFKKLNEMIREYSPFDENGSPKAEMQNEGKLTREQLEKLMIVYSSTMDTLHTLNEEAMKAARRSDFSKEKQEQYKKEVAAYNLLADTLGKDIQAIDKVEQEEAEMNLYEIFESSRVSSDYTVEEVPDTVNKGNMNERTQVIIKDKDHHVYRGYFTADTRIPGDHYVEDVFAVEKKKYQEAASGISLDLIWRFRRSLFEEITAADGKKKKNEEGEKVFNLIFSHKEVLIMSDYTKAYNAIVGSTKMNIAKYINTPEKLNAFVDITSKVLMAKNKKNLAEDIGMRKDANVNRRNAAMSKMAELLGRPNLLAKSENVKLNINGKELKGTFMHEAVGEDISKINEESLMLSSTAGSLENLNLKKQIADLQIIDYLCGNTDRHDGNMLYKFIMNDEGEVELTDINGIDHDSCFGENIVEYSNSSAYVPLESMRVITEDMAKRITALDEEGLKTLFYGYELNTKEINNVKNRLKKLKKTIENSAKAYEKGYEKGYLIPETIKIVSDEELNELSVEHDLAASAKNQHNLYKKILKNVVGKGNLEELQRKVKSDYYKTAYELTSGSVGEVNELLDRLKGDTKLGGSSPKYDEMLDNMKKLKKAVGGFKASAIDSVMIGHCKDIKAVRTLLTTTLESVNEYIYYKLGKKKGEEWRNIEGEHKASRTERRYYDAIACREFLSNQLLKFKTLDKQLDQMDSVFNHSRHLKRECEFHEQNYRDSEKYEKMMDKRKKNLYVNHVGRTAYMIREEYDRYQKAAADRLNVKVGEDALDQWEIKKNKERSEYLKLKYEAALGYGFNSIKAKSAENFHKFLRSKQVETGNKSVDELVTRAIAADFICMKYDLEAKKDSVVGLDAGEQAMSHYLANVDIEPMEGAVDRLIASEEFGEFLKKELPEVRKIKRGDVPGVVYPGVERSKDMFKRYREIYIKKHPDKMNEQEKAAGNGQKKAEVNGQKKTTVHHHGKSRGAVK